MEEVMKQVRELYAKANAGERQEIQEQVRDLQKDFYNDGELLFSNAAGVSLRCYVQWS
jgi:demethylsterigmatocystin 6-O-methyltransferase